MSLADRIVIMSEGKVEQIGTPMELCYQPASLFVAEFIGSPPMNAAALDSRLGAMMANAVGMASAGAATVGLRPETLRPVPAEGATLRGRVGMAEALGAETVLHMELTPGGPQNRLILRVNGPHPWARAMRPASPATLLRPAGSTWAARG